MCELAGTCVCEQDDPVGVENVRKCDRTGLRMGTVATGGGAWVPNEGYPSGLTPPQSCKGDGQFGGGGGNKNII